MFNLKQNLGKVLATKPGNPPARFYDELSEKMLEVFDRHALERCAEGNSDLLSAYHAIAMGNRRDVRELQATLHLPEGFEEAFKKTTLYATFTRFWELHDRVRDGYTDAHEVLIKKLEEYCALLKETWNVPEYETFADVTEMIQAYFERREHLAMEVRNDMVKRHALTDTKDQAKLDRLLDETYGYTGEHYTGSRGMQ
jgi:hypothetical protein